MGNFRTGIVIGFLAAAVIALAVALVIVSSDDSGSNATTNPESTPITLPGDSHPQPGPEPVSRKPTEAPTSGDETFGFQSPSGNIICRMDAESALCGIGEFNYSFPPDPSCQLAGYGRFLKVDSDGPAELACADGLPAPPDSPVLPYGQFVRLNRFECGSSRQGVYCEHLASGHGFALSRERYSTG